MQSRNVTVEQASNAIGVNPATFYRRIGGNGAKFTVSEVDKLADLLDLRSKEMQSIFFDKGLAETQERGRLA